MPLVILGTYFALLFVGVLSWSKLRQRREKNRDKRDRDNDRRLLRKIEEAEHSARAMTVR
jgi:hypothetical protein